MRTVVANTFPINHYWGLVKELSNDMKLELVSLLVESMKSHDMYSNERERTFRALEGCWVSDGDDDDIESILMQHADKRNSTRMVPAFDD